MNYYVEGEGEQAVNLGFNASQPSDPSEWTVITQDNVFYAEGQNWRLLPDDTMVIYGASGNLTVARYNYGYSTIDNQPFFMQHYVIILTAAAVAVTVTTATVIKLKTKTRQP